MGWWEIILWLGDEADLVIYCLCRIRYARFQSSQEGLTAFSPLCVFIQSATTLLPLSKNTKHVESVRG